MTISGNKIEKDYYKLAIESILHEASEYGKINNLVDHICLPDGRRQLKTNTSFLKNVIKNSAMHNQRLDRDAKEFKKRMDRKPSCSYSVYKSQKQLNQTISLPTITEAQNMKMTKTKPFILYSDNGRYDKSGRPLKGKCKKTFETVDSRKYKHLIPQYTCNKALQGPFTQKIEKHRTVYTNNHVQVIVPDDKEHHKKYHEPLESLKIIKKPEYIEVSSDESTSSSHGFTTDSSSASRWHEDTWESRKKRTDRYRRKAEMERQRGRH